MPVYEVIINESRELTYIVEADDPDTALERAGELWCADAEPANSEGYFDVGSVSEAE